MLGRLNSFNKTDLKKLGTSDDVNMAVYIHTKFVFVDNVICIQSMHLLYL